MSVHHVMSDLRVTAGAVESAGHGTATEAATRAFDRLRGFDGDRRHNRDLKHPVPVHGLGDQPELGRRWDQSPKRLAVSLMVRSRNVIVNVAMTKESATQPLLRARRDTGCPERLPRRRHRGAARPRCAVARHRTGAHHGGPKADVQHDLLHVADEVLAQYR